MTPALPFFVKTLACPKANRANRAEADAMRYACLAVLLTQLLGAFSTDSCEADVTAALKEEGPDAAVRLLQMKSTEKGEKAWFWVLTRLTLYPFRTGRVNAANQQISLICTGRRPKVLADSVDGDGRRRNGWGGGEGRALPLARNTLNTLDKFVCMTAFGTGQVP